MPAHSSVPARRRLAARSQHGRAAPPSHVARVAAGLPRLSTPTNPKTALDVLSFLLVADSSSRRPDFRDAPTGAQPLRTRTKILPIRTAPTCQPGNLSPPLRLIVVQQKIFSCVMPFVWLRFIIFFHSSCATQPHQSSYSAVSTHSAPPLHAATNHHLSSAMRHKRPRAPLYTAMQWLRFIKFLPRELS